MSTAEVLHQLRLPEPAAQRHPAGRDSTVGATLKGAALGSALGTTQQGRALLHELAHGYSRALYGEAGAFDLRSARVMWPSLLGREALELLGDATQCGPRHELAEQLHPFVLFPINFLQPGALWLHQPRLPAAPASHTWAEVSHCSYRLEGISARTPMWFLHAPGTGLWLNVGKSYRHPRSSDPLDAHTARLQRLLTLGALRAYAKEAGLPLATPIAPSQRGSGSIGVRPGNDTAAPLPYDSVQFEHSSAPSWRGERWTSIVMLAWGREVEFVADHLHRLRCGPSPARLRPCAADDAAVRMQGPSCFRSVRQHTTMVQLLNHSRCEQSTVSFGDSAIQRAAIADAEAQRLSRLHGVESVEEHKLVSLYDGNRTQTRYKPRTTRSGFRLGARG